MTAKLTGKFSARARLSGCPDAERTGNGQVKPRFRSE